MNEFLLIGVLAAAHMWAQSPTSLVKLPPGVYTNRSSPSLESTTGLSCKEGIVEAVSRPVDTSAIGVSVGTARVDKPAPNSMVLRLEVDPVGIGWVPNGDRMRGRIDVFLVQKSDKGNQFGGTDDAIEFNLTKAQYDKMMKSGGLILPDRTVRMVSQATQLRIVVCDDASGTIGSLTVPLSTVPRPKATGSASETPMAEPPPPPPPPTGEQPPTKTIEQGQTVEQVIAALGQPARIAKVGVKEIYFYKDLKVTFTDGKVSDVE